MQPDDGCIAFLSEVSDNKMLSDGPSRDIKLYVVIDETEYPL